MVDQTTQQCLTIIQDANKELIKSSETTFFSLPMLKNVPSLLKGQWLGEEDATKIFLECLNDLKISEETEALKIVQLTSGDNPHSSPIKEELIKRKKNLEKEIENMKEEQSTLKQSILESVKQFETNYSSDLKESLII